VVCVIQIRLSGEALERVVEGSEEVVWLFLYFLRYSHMELCSWSAGPTSWATSCMYVSEDSPYQKPKVNPPATVSLKPKLKSLAVLSSVEHLSELYPCSPTRSKDNPLQRCFKFEIVPDFYPSTREPCTAGGELFPDSCFSLFSPPPRCPSCVRTLARTNIFDVRDMASAQRLKHNTQT